MWIRYFLQQLARIRGELYALSAMYSQPKPVELCAPCREGTPLVLCPALRPVLSEGIMSGKGSDAEMVCEGGSAAPATGASRLNETNDPDGQLRQKLRTPYMGLGKAWNKETHKYMAEFKHTPIVLQVAPLPRYLGAPQCVMLCPLVEGGVVCDVSLCVWMSKGGEGGQTSGAGGSLAVCCRCRLSTRSLWGSYL